MIFVVFDSEFCVGTGLVVTVVVVETVLTVP